MSLYESAKQVVAKNQHLTLDGGILLDLFTASAVVAVYEALGEANKAKFDAMPAPVAAGVALKLVAA